MYFDEYQRLAARTAGGIEEDEKLLFGSLCLCGEAGELANLIKKVKWHGHDVDKYKIVSELGDCMWYISFICDTIGVTLDDVAEYNIHKLKARYPKGFSSEDSKGRKDNL